MYVEWIKVTLTKVDYSRLNRKSELLVNISKLIKDKWINYEE